MMVSCTSRCSVGATGSLADGALTDHAADRSISVRQNTSRSAPIAARSTIDLPSICHRCRAAGVRAQGQGSSLTYEHARVLVALAVRRSARLVAVLPPLPQAQRSARRAQHLRNHGVAVRDGLEQRRVAGHGALVHLGPAPTIRPGDQEIRRSAVRPIRRSADLQRGRSVVPHGGRSADPQLSGPIGPDRLSRRMAN